MQERLRYPATPEYALACQMHAIEQTHNVLDRLVDIQRPTLVLTGTADVLVPPQNSHMIAERIPNARLVEYEGAGHDFLHHATDSAINDVISFLAEVDAA